MEENLNQKIQTDQEAKEVRPQVEKPTPTEKKPFPVTPVIIGVIIVAIIAVGSYFLYFSNSSDEVVQTGEQITDTSDWQTYNNQSWTLLYPPELKAINYNGEFADNIINFKGNTQLNSFVVNSSTIDERLDTGDLIKKIQNEKGIDLVDAILEVQKIGVGQYLILNPSELSTFIEINRRNTINGNQVAQFGVSYADGTSNMRTSFIKGNLIVDITSFVSSFEDGDIDMKIHNNIIDSFSFK